MKLSRSAAVVGTVVILSACYDSGRIPTVLLAPVPRADGSVNVVSASDPLVSSYFSTSKAGQQVAIVERDSTRIMLEPIENSGLLWLVVVTENKGFGSLFVQPADYLLLASNRRILDRLQPFEAANLFQSQVSDVLYSPTTYVAKTSVVGTSIQTSIAPNPWDALGAAIANDLQRSRNASLINLAKFVFDEGMQPAMEVPPRTVLDKNVYFRLPADWQILKRQSPTLLIRIKGLSEDIEVNIQTIR